MASVAIRSHQLIPEALKMCHDRSYEGFFNTQTASERRYFKADGSLTSFAACLKEQRALVGFLAG